MLHCPWGNNYELPVDGVSMKFSLPSNEIKVSILTLHALFWTYQNSWGIMAVLHRPRSSNVKETSLLTLSELLQSSLQRSTKYLERPGTQHMIM